MAKLVILLAVVISTAFATDQDRIDRINSAQAFWKAEQNIITAMGIDYKRLLGTEFPEIKNYRNDTEVNIKIPKFFDARKKWPHCPSIGSVKNQGHCGACWAISAANAASDRICIATHGKLKVDISVENLLACCKDCWGKGVRGCDSGYPNRAWQYLHRVGVVTGGDYGSNKGCQPYELQPTDMTDEYDDITRTTNRFYTPACHKKCTNKKYKKPYKKDKHFGQTAFDIPKNVAKIQTEILRHGPVSAGFIVYDDFNSYSSGVYVRHTEEIDGGHAVKIIGWGVEKKVPYWLAVNSWGTDWGQKGTFKIRRGTDECSIESYVSAGLIKK